MKKSNNATPTDKSPKGSTDAPKAALSGKERADRIAQAMLNNLNFNVIAAHVGRVAAQAFLRKTYPHMTDEEIIATTAHIPGKPSPATLRSVVTPQEKARRLRHIIELNRRLGRKTLHLVK